MLAVEYPMVINVEKWSAAVPQHRAIRVSERIVLNTDESTRCRPLGSVSDFHLNLMHNVNFIIFLEWIDVQPLHSYEINHEHKTAGAGQ